MPSPYMIYLSTWLLGMARYMTIPFNSSILTILFEERILATASSAINMYRQIRGYSESSAIAIAGLGKQLYTLADACILFKQRGGRIYMSLTPITYR